MSAALIDFTADQTSALVVVFVLGAAIMPLALPVARRINTRADALDERAESELEAIPEEYELSRLSGTGVAALALAIVVTIGGWMVLGGFSVLVPLVLMAALAWRLNALDSDSFAFVEQDFPSFAAQESPERVELALAGLTRIYGGRRARRLRGLTTKTS